MEVVKIVKDNYLIFDDMVYWRMHGQRRSDHDKSRSVTDAIQNELRNDNLHIYGAVVEHDMVGWISLVYIPKVGRFNGNGHIYIDELWVEQSFRGQGIGQALMLKAEALKSKLKASGIRLYVNQRNTSAIKLYEQCGFNLSGETYFMEK